MQIPEEIKVSAGILNQINSSSDAFTIVAYDNDHTPFQIVFLVLRSVVPLSDEEAFRLTQEIHLDGKSVIYKGAKEHCYKIGDALDKIKVEYKIY